MIQKLKRKCRPEILLLTVGFAISFASVLIGISTINALISELSKADGETPIYWTMENTGLSLALAIYIFSVANCLVVTNYWIISKRRDMAIRKAFGWSNRQLIAMIVREMSETLLISFILGVGLLVLLHAVASGLFSVELTPFFVLGTCVLLLFTLCIAVSIPIIRILKIRPAEVVS
ncbi:MAG: FtsX-like permease family protein [Acutalibacteraceae bacterium]